MKEKSFNGKAIYNPSGKAGEYAEWACNFYVGCSNGCEYCYLKKGRGKAILGGEVPCLKKCFKSEQHAIEMFEIEVMINKAELKKYGLFFTFTSDPMLSETIDLTLKAMAIAIDNDIPVKVLTKCADWINKINITYPQRDRVAFGFTLTGHDELESGASINNERIELMKKLHKAGFKTFASIEPIIDLDSSFKMITQTMGHCDLYKIGLESGKTYDKRELVEFMGDVASLNHSNEYPSGTLLNIYFKDSLLKQTGISRESLPSNCVGRDYNMFND